MRLGAGGPKALVELAGRPILAWSVGALARAERVGAIVVAAPPGFEGQLEGAVSAAIGELLAHSANKSPTVEVSVLPGGATRAESVQNALARVRTETVVIHDAARPLVTPSLADSVVGKLAARPDADAVIAAAPITDTVKRAREPRPAKGEFPGGGPTVGKTESREHLWAAQTPQAFRTERLRAAYAEADPQRIAAATDEAMLIEKSGGKVLIEPAPAWNLKVTMPEDLPVAELLLRRRS
jgi:2-C-methyl-D-erythritol 4-phosphate cytidylyltransferase